MDLGLGFELNFDSFESALALFNLHRKRLCPVFASPSSLRFVVKT
jgi:hypothetical protein